jgi:hypothetical protein
MGSLVYICPATGEEVSTGYIAEYEDGSKHVFAVPQSTLEQGLPNEGRYSIACIVAYEWQQDGYLKPGKIATVYRLS